MKPLCIRNMKSAACLLGVILFVSATVYGASGPGNGGGGSGLPKRLIINGTCDTSVNNVVELEVRVGKDNDLLVGGSVNDTSPVTPWSIEIGHLTLSTTTGGPSSSRDVLVTGPAIYDAAEAQWLGDPLETTPNTNNSSHQFDIIATRGLPNRAPEVTCTGKLNWTNPADTNVVSPGPTPDNPNSFPNRAPRFPASNYSVWSSQGAGTGRVFLVADEILNEQIPAASQFQVKVNGVPRTINGPIQVVNGDPDADAPIFLGALVFNVSGNIPVGASVEVKYVQASFPNIAVNVMDPQGLKTANFTRTTAAVSPP